MVSRQEQQRIRKQVAEQQMAGLSNERIRANIKRDFGGTQTPAVTSQAKKSVTGDISQASTGSIATQAPTPTPRASTPRRTATGTATATPKPTTPNKPQVDFKFGADARASGFQQQDFDNRNRGFIDQFKLDDQFSTREEALRGVGEASKGVISNREFQGATQDEFKQTLSGIADQVKLKQAPGTQGAVAGDTTATGGTDVKSMLLTRYQDDLARVNEEGQRAITGAIEKATLSQGQFQGETDKFTNFPEIDDRNKSVINAIVERRIAKNEAGQPISDTVSQDEIQFAMEQTGVDFDTAQKIVQGEGYEDLQFTEDARGDLTRNVDRQMEDREIANERRNADLERNLEGVRDSYNNQIGDVRTTMERNLAATDKMGALTGRNRASGFIQGLDNIQRDGEKVIGRLQKALSRAESATDEEKGRLMQDFNTQVGRAKEDMDRDLNNIKIDFGAQAFSARDSLSGDELGRELDKIARDLDDSTLAVYNQLLDANSKIQQSVSTDLDLIEQFDNIKEKKSEQFVNSIVANDGAALASSSADDIIGWMDQGLISGEQAQGFLTAMEGQTIATLRQLGLVTSADIETVSSNLDSGMSPNEIISSMQDTGRFAATPDVAEKTVFDTEGGTTTSQIVSNSVKSGSNLYSSIPDLGLQAGQPAPQGSRYASIGNGVISQMGNDWESLVGFSGGTLTEAQARKLADQSGIDIPGNIGDPISSPYAGEITKVVSNAKFGNTVEVTTEDGVVLQFNHLDDLNNHETGESLATGQMVSADQNFANLGNSGISTGPHLDMAGRIGNEYMSIPDLANYTSTGQLPDSELLKASQLERVRQGNLTNTAMGEMEADALKGGWIEEFTEAQNKGFSTKLNPETLAQFNSERDDFRGNAVVKSFEESMVQAQNLVNALNSESGAGDMAAVFGFMKSLDPSSTVRESEFEAAASTAGLAGKGESLLKKVSTGEILTDQQREDFKAISKQFVMSRAGSYDRLYGDMGRVLEASNIDQSLRPTSASDELRKMFEEEEAGTTQTTQTTEGKIAQNEAAADIFRSDNTQQAQADQSTGESFSADQIQKAIDNLQF